MYKITEHSSTLIQELHNTEITDLFIAASSFALNVIFAVSNAENVKLIDKLKL